MRAVLIVDDDDHVRDGLTRLLEAQGYRCSSAHDAPGARDLLREHFFDLVLSDIQMPGPSGLDLLRQVASELPNTAFVMVTGVDDPEVAREALQLGAYGYIVKPFNTNEILINVMNALKRLDLETQQRLYSEEIESKLVDRNRALAQAIQQLEESETGDDLPWRETAERLGKALALRDEETGRHIERVGLYSELLAERWGDAPWPPVSIRHAAMLHDAGKIGIPDAILQKHAALTPEERRIIERHAELGFQLLAGSRSLLLELAASIALTHHEHWDGKGYPRGLRGGEIPLEGRITAVADVFDALTSDRVYRQAFAVEEAVSMMLEGRGKHFDPDLIDLFTESLDDVLVIRAEHPDEVTLDGPMRVFLVDDQELFVEAMARLLDATEGISVVGQAASVDEAVQRAPESCPDVLVVDWTLPDGTGSDVVRAVKDRLPDTKALLLTGSLDERILVEGIQAGCAAVVTKNKQFEDLVEVIKATHAGEVTIPAASLASVVARLQEPRAAVATLTPRELEVLALLAEGLSNDAIAERLVVSLHTVRNHVQNIISKTGTHSKLEAVATALRQGLVDLPQSVPR